MEEVVILTMFTFISAIVCCAVFVLFEYYVSVGDTSYSEDHRSRSQPGGCLS
jgi:hypothetical protein